MTLERIEHKVFASEAPLDEMGQFGSALATTKLNTKDVAEIQALPAYTKGWGSAIISENNYPAMEEMNGVLNVMSYHTGYLYQEGIPTYSATQEYSVTSWVKDLAGEKVYKSLQGGNKGHDLTDPAWWEELKLGGGGLEIGDVGFTQMAIDESKGKRRVLNGQLIIQDQYAQFANIIKNSVALNPDLACTEAEWQTELTMSANGVCYKYVIDDEAGTIRLPKYPEYLDLSINTGAVSQAVSVYGTGKGLGLINGSQTNIGAFVYGGHLYGRLGLAGRNVGAGSDGNGDPTNNQVVGFSKDPSLSGLTGKVTVPAVESEKIKGTYFIQVATGAETEDNIINEIELNNPFSLLDYKYSEYELNNLSWLRSEGQYNSKAIYPAVYDLLLKIYNGTETKAGVSVKLTTETFTDYDFVLNTAEETFRLPVKVKLANLTSEGIIPVYATDGSNKTYNFTTFNGADNYNLYDSMYLSGAIANNTKSHNFTMKADLSQVANSDLYLYFYVGETVQNANLVNIGRIQETYTTKSMVDGQWVTINESLASNLTISSSSCVYYDISEFLPNDGFDYEVRIQVAGATATAINSVAYIAVGSGEKNNPDSGNIVICQTKTQVANNSQLWGGSAIILVKAQNRKIYIAQQSGSNVSSVAVRLVNYRRIGTNL